MSVEEPVRILIADNTREFREHIRGLLAAQPALAIVAEAGNSVDALQLAAQTLPDLVLLDLQMPDLNAIETTRRLTATSPNLGVLVVTMFEDAAAVFAAMRAGARGYLLKSARKTELLQAIQVVVDGEAMFSPAIARRLITFFAMNRPPTLPFPELTAQEREILTFLAQGADNQAIAATFSLSLKTVHNQVANIYAKLQLADRTLAAVRAHEAGS